MTIDEKIASLKLDNSQFKKAADETIKDVDKLNKSMKFDSAADSLDEVSKSMKKLPTKEMGDDVDEVNSKFSALGMVAEGALKKIGADIETFVASKLVNIVKDLSGINNMVAGYEKYETVTNAVQVLTANTGMAVSEVQERIDSLRWYSDETSYSLNDMTDALAKFTNAGVDIDVATEAIQGIGSWAAASGVDAKKAASAFYNLSQAMGMGYLGGMDAKSIQMLNMLGPEFKKTAIAAGIAAGKVEDLGNGLYKAVGGSEEFSVESMSESLKDKWLDVDVLNSTLKQYSKYSTDLKKYMEEAEAAGKGFNTSAEAMVEFDKYIEEHGLETEYALSQKAFTMGQVAKTLGEAIDATKDAASSSWYSIIQSVVGDLDEAKKLWTAVTNEMWDVFVGPLDYLDGIFKEWHDAGGRELLLEGLKEIYTNIKTVVGTVKEVFTDAFGSPTVDSLMKITNGIKNFGKAIKPSEQFLNGLRNTVKGFTNILKLALYILEDVFYNIKTIAKPLLRIAKTLFSAFGSLFKQITNGFDELSTGGTSKVGWFIDTIVNAVDWLFNIIKTGLNVVESGIDVVKAFLNPFKNVFSSMLKANKDSEVFEDTWDSITKPIRAFIDLAKNVIDKLREIGVHLRKDIAPIASSLGGKFGAKAFEHVVNFLKFVNYDALPFISYHLENIREAIKEMVSNFNLKDKINDAKDAIGNFFDKFKKNKDENNLIPELDPKNNLAITNKLTNFGKVLQDNTSSKLPEFSKALSRIDRAGYFEKLSKNLENTTSKTDKIKSVFQTIGEFLKGVGLRIKNFFVSIYEGIDGLTGGRLSEAVKSIKELIGHIKSGDISIWTIIENIIKAGVLKKLIDFLFGFKKDKKSFLETFTKIGESIAEVGTSISEVLHAIATSIKANALIKLAVAVGLLVVALLSMISIPTDKLAKSGGVITIFVAELMLALKAMSTNSLKKGASTTILANSFMKIALGVLLLVAALKLVSNLPEDKIDSGIRTISTVIIILTTSLKVLQKCGGADKVGKGMSKIATALLKMVAVIWLLGSINPDKAKAGINIITTLLSMITAVMLALGKASAGMLSATSAINAMSKLLMKLTLALLIVSFISPEKLNNSVSSLIKIVGVVSLIVFVLGSMSNSSINVSALEQLNKSINTITSFMIKMAAIMLLLGSVDPVNMVTSALSMASLAGVALVILQAMNLITSSNGAKPDKILEISSMLGTISGAMIKMAASILIVGGLPIANIIASSLAVLSMMVLSLVLINVMAKLSHTVNGSGIANVSKLLSSITSAILMMSIALRILGGIEPERMLTSVAGLAAIALCVYILTSVMNGKGFNPGRISKGLLSISMAIILMSTALLLMSTIPDIKTSIIGLAAVVVAIIVLSKFSGNIRKLGRGLSSLTGALVKLLIGVATAFTIMAGGLGALTAAIGYITEIAILAGSFGPQVERGMNVIGNVIVKVITAVVDALFEALYRIVKGLEEYGPKIITSLINFLVNGLKAINERLPELLEEIGKFITKVIDEFGKMLPEILDSLKNTLTKIIDWLKENLVPFLEDLEPLIEDILDWAGRFLIKFLKDFSDWIDDHYYEIIDAVWDVVTSVLSLMFGLLGGWSTNAKFTKFREDVTGFAKEVMGSLKDGFTKYVETTVEAFTTLGERIKEKLGPVIKYVEGFIAKVEEYWDAFTYQKKQYMGIEEFVNSSVVRNAFGDKYIEKFNKLVEPYVAESQGFNPKYDNVSAALTDAQKYLRNVYDLYTDEEYSKLMGLFMAYTRMQSEGGFSSSDIEKFAKTVYKKGVVLEQDEVFTYGDDSGGHGAFVKLSTMPAPASQTVKTALSKEEILNNISSLEKSKSNALDMYGALNSTMSNITQQNSPLVVNGNISMNMDVDDVMTAKNLSEYLREQIASKASHDASYGRVGR